jgi:hypothetical protein
VHGSENPDGCLVTDWQRREEELPFALADCIEFVDE